MSLREPDVASRGVNPNSDLRESVCDAWTVDDPLDSWETLPRRVYLDTNTLQTIFDYAGQIWENETFVPADRDKTVPDLEDDIQALGELMAVNQRAGFEFVVTEASLSEVSARREPLYLQWVLDVLDVWIVQSGGEKPAPPRIQRIGSVSSKDWNLLRDALAYRCDAFLTMERRLFSQAPVIEHRTRLRILRPTTYWHCLRPWAALYR